MNTFILTKNTVIASFTNTEPIQNAISILRRDMMETLFGDGPENSIQIVREKELKPESYQVKITGKIITVSCCDDLGAVYGLLSLSERYLNVHPFSYWNGLAPRRQEAAVIPCGTYRSPKYAVRFRGYFINDEVLLDGWKDTPEETLEMWKRIFETILRCGGNMVIPGTDRKEDGDQLSFLALQMGLWLTQHHTELLGARMFARAYPGVEASYTKHPDLFESLWREAAAKFAGQKVIWSVGYRGQGDCAFWENEKGFDSARQRGGMIALVMHRQMEIVREKDPNALFCTNLYGEMMDLYRQGFLPLPEEIIKVWGDNGYGKMVSRRTGNDNPRVPSMPVKEPGLNGLYYHASFYDLQAANHVTMSQNSPVMLERELSQALLYGADAYWNINVGSIKPHTYILDLIRNVWTSGHTDVWAHARGYARMYYGNERVADLLLSFSKYTLVYGPNEDDRAGDQYYHFVLRHFARGLMGGKAIGIKRLYWAAGQGTFAQQADEVRKQSKPCIKGWEEYLASCREVQKELAPEGAQLLSDTVILQGMLHLTGCRALYDVCRAVDEIQKERYVEAFLHISRAISALHEGVQAMENAEHGEFLGYYRNECFSNVRLSVRVLKTLRGYLRAMYDGEHFYDWERRYLYPPEDRNVWCLTHRKNQMNDESLAKTLFQVIELGD